MNWQLIDIGVNLLHARFHADRDEVIERAVKAGVRAMVVTGTSARSSRGAVELARRHPGLLFSTAGVHPHDARHWDEEVLAEIKDLARSPQVVAIGECGLDFDRDFSPRPVQERCFEAQLSLACELGLPLFLHERAAHARFVSILGAARARLPPAVVHCFTGNASELKTYLDLGLHIGITGWICDERRGVHLRELVRGIAWDRLMLETDAPFLTPRTLTPRPAGGRNEPAFLPEILREVAGCLGRPELEVARATTETAMKFFRLAGSAGPQRTAASLSGSW
jgi:TatD DNase family protein